MSNSTKKTGLAFYVTALGGLVGIAGLIALVISSTMSSTNTLGELPMIAALAVVGIACIVLSLLVFPRLGMASYLCPAAGIAAIALFTVVIGNVISSRILLISGLFSFNSGNTVGWSVFYVTVASLVCFLVAILLLIISAFMKPAK